MLRTEEGEALTGLILETFRLNGALLSAGNELTKPLGLTSARWQVMGAIEQAGQAITVAQIARRMGLARQSVQRIVNDLVAAELLQLQSNQDHKRASLVAISETGAQVMAKIDQVQADWVNELCKGFTGEQIEAAQALLERLRRRLDGD